MFGFVPQGFFSHLVSRMLQQNHIKVDKFWKDAMIISAGSLLMVLQMIDDGHGLSTQRDVLCAQV